MTQYTTSSFFFPSWKNKPKKQKETLTLTYWIITLFHNRDNNNEVVNILVFGQYGLACKYGINSQRSI